MRLVFKVKNTKTLNLRANSFIGRIGMGMEYFLFKRGPMTMAPSQLGGFAKSDPSKESANLQYHIQPLSTEKLGDPLHPSRHSLHQYVICDRKVEGIFE